MVNHGKKRAFGKNMYAKVEFPILPDAYKINNCYFKKQYIASESTHISGKFHHHTFFEAHFVTQGGMEYFFENESISLLRGSFILIAPNVTHRTVNISSNTLKYSLAFTFENDPDEKIFHSLQRHSYLTGEITGCILSCLEFTVEETACNKPFSSLLISNRIFEIICSMIRLSGPEEHDNRQNETNADARLTLAKQYIDDNLCFPLSCEDVSKYCHLSGRQLSRIFIKNDGLSLAEYIHLKKRQAAEALITDNIFSLREISEKLGFNDEYYFNTFFKKHAGMSPGEYRKATT